MSEKYPLRFVPGHVAPEDLGPAPRLFAMDARDPLRVPLHTEAETIPRPLDRLDHAVGGAGRYAQPLAGSRDGLVMRAVDRLRIGADHRFEKGSRLHPNGVAALRPPRAGVRVGFGQVEWDVVEE